MYWLTTLISFLVLLVLINGNNKVTLDQFGNIKATETRKFQGETLAFVTPWNGRGYDVVKDQTLKFDYVSPVWLQVRPVVGSTKFMITGQHDIDSTWVSIVQKQGASVLPRLQFDWSHWTQQDFNVFFGGGFSDKIHQPLIDSIIKLVQERSFDGLVIEWGFLDTENILPVMKPMLTALFQELRLNTKSRQLFLVIPPFRGDPNQQSFTSQHYSQLLDVVDRFCVMTYDASGGRPSPNAPLKDFVIPTIDYFTKGTDQDLKASKLLLGLNFYGYKYSLSSQPKMDVVLGHDYKSIMSKHSPQLHWDENSAENFFDYTNEEGVQARVFYPSVRSIMARTKVATDRNLAGVMIWEVGQGLTEFVDLL